jgi:hypothetical protein
MVKEQSSADTPTLADRQKASAVELLEQALDRRFADRLMASAIHEIANLASRYAIASIDARQAAFLIAERLRYIQALERAQTLLAAAETGLFEDLNGRYPTGHDHPDQPPGTEVALSNSNPEESKPEIENPEQLHRNPNSETGPEKISAFAPVRTSGFGIRDFLSRFRFRISSFAALCRQACSPQKVRPAEKGGAA